MERITFKQFIYTHNFRYINDLRTDPYNFDTQIIRIYPPNDSGYERDWFEFGINDFSDKDYTWNICKRALDSEILDSYVEMIQYNSDYNNVLTIYLTKHKKVEV